MRVRSVLIASLAGLSLLLSIFIGCDESAFDTDASPDPISIEEPDEVIDDDTETDEAPMSASLRAAVLKSRQNEGGPAFHASMTGKLPTFTNGPHRLKAEMDNDSLRMIPLTKDADWTVEMRLDSMARGIASEPSVRATRTVEKNQATFSRGYVTEWYLNGPAGLEQGFDIAQRPPGFINRRPGAEDLRRYRANHREARPGPGPPPRKRRHRPARLRANRIRLKGGRAEYKLRTHRRRLRYRSERFRRRVSHYNRPYLVAPD